MRELANTSEALDALPHRGLAGLADRLADAPSVERADRRARPRVARLVRRLAGGGPGGVLGMAAAAGSRGLAPIGKLAEEVGWSRRHLATRFRNQVGAGAQADGPGAAVPARRRDAARPAPGRSATSRPPAATPTTPISPASSASSPGAPRRLSVPAAEKPANDRPLERLRRLCLALPEATERLSHGEPTWFVRGKKMFVTSADHHHDDRLAFWCAAPAGAQDALVAEAPERYFVPPYVGGRGWLGVYLDVPVDWPRSPKWCRRLPGDRPEAARRPGRDRAAGRRGLIGGRPGTAAHHGDAADWLDGR